MVVNNMNRLQDKFLFDMETPVSFSLLATKAAENIHGDNNHADDTDSLADATVDEDMQSLTVFGTPPDNTKSTGTNAGTTNDLTSIHTTVCVAPPDSKSRGTHAATNNNLSSIHSNARNDYGIRAPSQGSCPVEGGTATI